MSCYYIGSLSVHGKCARCDSPAVIAQVVVEGIEWETLYPELTKVGA